jgi:hypothetical protein
LLATRIVHDLQGGFAPLLEDFLQTEYPPSPGIRSSLGKSIYASKGGNVFSTFRG